MPSPAILTAQFVDGPSATATLRYDFFTKNSSYRTHILNEGGFDLGTAPWSGEPEGIGGSYGYRQMRFTQRVEGTKANAMARLAALAREMVRPTNWLKVQLSTELAPVYFKTYRGDPGALNIEHVESSQAWDITVPLTADPFAREALVTMSPITINNDPAAGSNPCRAVLPAITGDAPTPLKIEMNPSGSVDLTGFRHMFAVQSTNASVAGPVVWPIGGSDGWTAAVDTSASEADGTMSGGNRRSVTFATVTALQTRLTNNTTLPALPTGRYRAFLRFGRSTTSGKFSFRLLWGYLTGATATTNRGTTTTATLQSWVDLGEFQHPPGHNPPKGQEGTAVVPTAVDLQVGRLSGTSEVRLDALLIVPVDSTDTIQNRILFSEQPSRGIAATAGVGVWDGENEAAYAFDSSGGGATKDYIAEMQGQFPSAVPGAVNTLHHLQQVDARDGSLGLDATDVLTATSVLTISYYPYRLHLGG